MTTYGSKTHSCSLIRNGTQADQAGGFPGGPQQGQNGETPGGGQMVPGGGNGELISYLEKHQDGAKWLLAMSSSQSAAQLIVSSGEPVISM
ncbi:hypothetical protein SNL152K_6499 [Streptomyces sp. NL15-2K]|nr:hypothetical protein SNL152K_6499 [Streptomyces sp. NL15-2K]